MPQDNPRRITRALERKLRLDFRSGSERNAWYVLDGRKQLRVTIPRVHGSSFSPEVLRDLRNQLKLNQLEFDNLVTCPMTGSNYANKIRELLGLSN